ncbi:MAG: hypothetical protein K2N22_03130 [Clostridia bacterium]|nr:hypothetical protein [Clostridia bacterium]
MKTKNRNLLTVILALLCAVLFAVGVSFALPKNSKPITANAADAKSDINPTIDPITQKKHNETGGWIDANAAYGKNPESVAYGDFNEKGNLSILCSPNPTAPYIQISNTNSTLDMDMGFVEFSMNVLVPAGAKVTAKYTFNINLRKIADGDKATSLFSAEFYHFGTGNESDGKNPEDTSKMSFYPSNSVPHAKSQRRLDGGTPTDKVPCVLKPNTYGEYNSDHGGFTYYDVATSATKTENCVPDLTAEYSTDEIVYNNTSNETKTYKEYFGFMACTGIATGACHILDARVNITPQVNYEKVNVPSSDAPSKTYSGEAQNFTIKDYTEKTELIKVVRKDIKGVDTTLYTKTDGGETGTNPISGNSCSFTEVGKYSLYFKPKSARWKDTLGEEERTLDLYVLPKFIKVPTVANNDTTGKTYNGEEQTFNVRGAGPNVLAAADWKTYINIDTDKDGVLPDGVTDNKDGTLGVTDVGDYDVKFTLVNDGNTCWDDKTASFSATAWVTSDWGGARTVSLKIKAAELKIDKLDVDKKSGVEWKWSSGEKATVDIIVSGFVLEAHATEGSESKVTLNYYYVADGESEKYVSATKEVYDPVAKTITATVEMPTDIAKGKYTFGVKPDESTGSGKNYSVDSKTATKKFTVESKDFDPSVLLWTYNEGNKASGKTLAQNGKLAYTIDSTGTVITYAPKIVLSNDDYDYTDMVALDGSYSGDVTKSATGTYKTVIKLKMLDANSKFVNSKNDGNIVVSADGKGVTLTLNWEIEKGTFDLSKVKWEYSLDGSKWTEYDSEKPPQYNDGNYITVRIKASTLPSGLTLDELYEGSEEYDVDSYTATVSASDLKYNTSNFNAPDASKLNLDWKIVKKNLFTSFKNVKETYSNANGTGSFILKQVNVDDDFKDYIVYKYYDKDGNEVSLDDIKDDADPTKVQKYKVEAYIHPDYASNYEVNNKEKTPEDNFETGSKNKLATATIGGKDGTTAITAVYDGTNHFDKTVIKITGDDKMNVTDFTVKYYKGTKPDADNELPANELPKDAGEYCVEIILGTTAAKKYILATDVFTVTVEAQGIALPVLGEMTFNGKELNFVDYLSGDSWKTYGPAGKDIIKVDGKLSDRNVGAGNYVTTLTITDTNYKWIYPETKAVAKYSRASEVKVTGDDVIATYNWNITPLVVDTAKMWNKGKSGATLNLPQNIRDFIAGGTLEVGYRYYDSDGQFVEEPELKSGKSFKVEAVFSGDDAERNIVFKTGDNEFGAVSKGIDYTVPTSGAAVFFGKVKDALTTSYAGLPLWAWLLIALAVLILLIIIIVVAVKRRKTKEEKEEIKARKEEERLRKEEEKARREEERRLQQERLEEERRLQREKLEAERELAKAKQEAELEKIRAQAQAGLAGAGMASMAMAQPQQQIPPQAMPTPVQQVQSVDNELLKEMRQQMAELRADNKATQAQLQAMQNNQNAQQPMQPMYQQMPMPQPQYMPQYYQQPMGMPMPNYGGGNDMALARMEAQLNAMQAEQRARYDAEQRIELAAMRAESHVDRDSRHSVDLAAMREHINGHNYNRIPDYSQQSYNQPNSMDMMGALVAATLRNMANGELAVTQSVPELPQKTETAAPAAKYPSDAVITTTTTVDTTKNKPLRREEDDGRIFDSDGFYDTFE